MINIRPVSDLRNKYPEIEDLVLKENEAVYLTKNGEGDLVVMDIDTYNCREAAFALREELLEIEDARRDGVPDFSSDDVADMMRQAVKKAAKR